MVSLFFRRYYKSILTATLITWLSLSEGSSISPGRFLHIPHADKVGHFLIYMFFSAILLLDSCGWQKSGRFRYIILIIPVAFGAVMELLQRLLTHGRQADIFDLAANIIGIFAGIFFALVVKKFLK